MARRVPRRPFRHRATALVLTWVLPAASVPGRASAIPLQGGSGGAAVRPILECVRQNGPGSFTAFFGYRNDGGSAVTIPAGENNGFFPGSDRRGQPTVFSPGRSPHHPSAAFSVDFEGALLVWTLRGGDGQARTASASSQSPRCSGSAASPAPTPAPTPTPTPAATPAPDASCALPVFGPKRYTRVPGGKTTSVESFTVPASAAGPFTLSVQNGDPTGRHRSLLWVRVNGELVVRPRDLHSHRGIARDEDDEDDDEDHRGCGDPVAAVLRTLALAPGSVATLKVTLVGMPGSFVTVRICGLSGDAVPPLLSWSEPAPDSFTNDATPRLVARYADAGSGVDPASFQAFLDDADVSSLFTRRSDEASADLPGPLALADGIHALRASVRDRAGLQASATSSFTVDLSAPAIGFAEPLADTFLSSSTTRVRVSYADDGASASGLDAASLRVLVNGQDRSAEFTRGPFEAVADLASLPSGPNLLVASIRDRAGNQGSASRSVNVDTQPPSLQIAAPQAGARLGSSSVDIEVRYADDQALDIASFAATLDGQPVSLTPVDGGAIGRVGPLAEGAHALAASIRDRAGHLASASAEFTIDTTLPALAIVQPLPGAPLSTATPLVEIDFHESPDVVPATLRVRVDGVDRTPAFAVTPTGAVGTLPTLSDGAHEVLAEILDGAGNRGVARVSFVVDTQAPTAALVEPAPGSFVGDARATVRVTFEDGGSGVNPGAVRLFVDGADVSDGVVRGEGGLSWTPMAPLADGEHSVRIELSDRAGNASAAEGRFGVDTLAPVLSFEAPVPDAFVNDATPELRLRYADAASGADPGAVHVFLRSGGEQAPEVEISGSLEVLADVARGEIPGPLGEGTHRLRAVVADRAGNTRELLAAFEVDVTAPVFRVESPAPSAIVPNTTPALVVSYGDDRAGVDPALLRLRVDGVDRSARLAHATAPCTESSLGVCGRAEGALSPDEALSQGPHTLEVTVVDRAGNAAAVGLSEFAVDSIVPAAEVVEPAAGAYLATATPLIRVRYRDVCSDGTGAVCPASGVDPAGVRIFIDGANRTVEFEVGPDEATLRTSFTDGTHSVRVEVADRAGLQAQAIASFVVDTRAPVVTPELADGAYVGQLDADGRFEIKGQLSDTDPDVSVQCRAFGQSHPATSANGQFSCRVPLQEGRNDVSVVARDRNGHETEATRAIHLDLGAPAVFIEEPAAGAVTAAQTIAVRVRVTDASPVTVVVDGQPAACDEAGSNGCAAGGSTTYTAAAVPVGGGTSRTIAAVVTDAAGHATTESVTVGIDRTPPTLTITAPSAAFLKGGVIDVAGEGADETPVAVEVNGLPAVVQPAGPGPDGRARFTFSAQLPAVDGAFRITAVARDAAGNQQSAFSDLNLDSAPPQIAITAPPQPFATNAAAATVSGTVSDASPVTVLVNGQPTACAATPGCAFDAVVPLGEQSASVDVVARDAAGNESSTVVAITVDRTHPTLTIETPLDGAAVGSLPLAVAGVVSDATTVSVTVNGGTAAVTGSAWHAQLPALAEGPQELRAIAVDAAGNQTQLVRNVVVDLGAPVLVVTAPESGLLTAAPNVTVTGSVLDRSDVRVRVRGLPIETVVPRPASPVAVPFSLGPLPLAEGDNAFVIEAIDATNRSFEIPLTITRDQTPPALELLGPASISRGRPGQATGAVSDAHFDRVEVTLSCVSGSGGALPCAPVTQSFTTPAFVVPLAVPENAAAGDSLLVQALAFDRAGNSQAASRSIAVASDGAVVGQVLDDATGLPLAGAVVELTATGGVSAPQQDTATSDERGRYSIATAGANALLLATKDGFTSVERTLGVASGAGTLPVDARLQALAKPVEIGADGGPVKPVAPDGAPASHWAAEIERFTVAIPAGAMGSYRLTPLSSQGLPNLLPLGWSPVAAFDLRAGGAAAPTSLSPQPTLTGLPSGPLHLVRYDFAAHAWRMVAADLSPSSGALTTTLPALGAYALVVPDTLDPPLVVPAAGGPLEDGALVAVPMTAASTGQVVPAVIPPSGGTARGSVVVHSPVVLPSGTVIQAEVTEQYTLTSGAVASEEKRALDIVVYRPLCPAGTAEGAVCASFPITPSRSYGTAEVASGTVHLDILAGREGVRGTVGGSEPVMLEVGAARLFVPRGALAKDTAFVLEEQPPSAFLPASAGLTALAEVATDFGGQTLSIAAELSVGAAAAAAAAAGGDLVFAKVERLAGIPRLAVVALGQLEADRVVSKPYPGLPGIVNGGRYVLYRLGAPIGFVAGVTSSSSGPVRAVVEPASDDPGSLPFLALAGSDGRYALASATGTRTIRATVAGTALVAIASVVVSPLATTSQNFALAGAVTTATVNPPDGALGVSTTATIEIASATPFDVATLVPANFTLQRLPAAAGDAPLALAFRLVASSSGKLVTLVPESRRFSDGSEQPALEYSRSYRLSATGLADSVGGLVVVPTVTFRTKDFVAPFYDARKLVFGMPNADGIVTVTAPGCHPEPGCFYPGTTILIINSGNGVVLSLTAGNNGEIASELPASINDTMFVTISDPFGNTTSFQKSEFVNQTTGETGVGPGGGVVRSLDGATELRIADGALENGVTFKVSLVPETELPNLFPNNEHERILEGGHLGSMVRIEPSQEVKFRKEVDLAFPLPDFTQVPESERPAKPEDAFYFIHRRVERCPDGTTTCAPEQRIVVFETIDDAKVEGEGPNARVVTASFPFAGIQAATESMLMVLGWWLKEAQSQLPPLAAVSGKVLRAKFNQTTQAMEYVPVEGALVSGYDLGGERLIDKAGGSYATSQKDGTFGLKDPHYSGGQVLIYAILGEEVAQATAYEVTGGWAAHFRKGATANITFPEQAEPPPPPLLQIHVRRKSDAKEVGGYTVAGVPLTVSFTSNYAVTGVQIEGSQYSAKQLKESATDLLSWELDTDYVPAEVGTVEIVATARSSDTGANITVTRSVRVLAAGGAVDNLPTRAPRVTAVEPNADEVGVPVSAFLQVFFSEPVKNVRDVAASVENVTLAELDANGAAGQPLPIRISGVRPTGEAVPNITSASDTVTSLSIEPLLGLKYGQRYRATVKSGIQDLDKDAQQNPAPKSLQAFTWSFETFGPESVGGSAEATGSPGIAVIGSRAYLVRTNNFANGTLEGYRIDDPVLPAKLPEEEFFAPRPYDIAGSGQDTDRLVAIATGSTSYSKPASVMLYDVTNDEDFRWVGAATVASNAYEGFITRLQIFGGSVYTATVRRGIQVVDIATAKAQMDALLRRSNPTFELQKARADLNYDGIGFGHGAVVQTLPLPQKPNNTDYYLNDLKVSDLAGQTIVVVTGEPGLVVASPAFGTINYNGRPEKTEAISGGGQRVVTLEWGHALALARLNDRDVAVVVGLGKIDGAAKTLLLAIDLANLAAPAIAGYLDLGPHLNGLQPVDVLLKDDTALIGLQNGARDQGAVLLVSLADITKPIFAGRLQGLEGKPLGGRLALTDTGLLLSTAKASLGGATPLGGIRTAAFDTVGAVLPVNPVLAKFVPGSNLEREQTLKDIPLQMRTYPKSQKVPELVLELFEGGAPIQPPLAFTLNNGAAAYTVPKGLVKDVEKEITAKVSFSFRGKFVASSPRLLPITAIRLTLDSNNDTIVEDKDDEDVLTDPNQDDPDKAIRLTFWEADARFDPNPLVSADPAFSVPVTTEYLPILTDFAVLRLQMRADVAKDERIGVVLKDSRLELVDKAAPVVGWPSSCLGDPREYKGKEHLCHRETATAQTLLLSPYNARPKPAPATPQGVVEIPRELLKKGDNFVLFRCKGQGGDTPSCPGTSLEVVRLTDQAPETIDSRRVELLPFNKLAGMVTLRRTGNPDSEDPMDPSYRVAPEARPLPGWASIPTNVDDLTLYVHGYNVTEGEFQGRTARGWFGTGMKRLYWAGHRVLATQRAFSVGVSWPGDIPGDILTLKRLPYYAEDEFNALQAGLPLGGFIKELRQRPGLAKLNILAHSLGNMVVNNALKEVPTEEGAAINYVMNQAAISSEAFVNQYSPQAGADADVNVRTLVQHAQALGFPNVREGIPNPDLRWIQDEDKIEQERLANECLTGPTEYSPSSRSNYCVDYTSSGLQLPKECRCDNVTLYFKSRYLVNPELDATLQETTTTASTPFFKTRWGKVGRNADLQNSLQAAWTTFFFGKVNSQKAPDGIRIVNTFNREDAVLRIDAGTLGLDTSTTTPQFHVWRIGQVKGKPFKTISSIGEFAVTSGLPFDGDDPLNQQKWWTLALPGRPSWWRSTAEAEVLDQQRSVWNGRSPDGATLTEEERLKAIARRTRLWAELAIWYPALSTAAGAFPLEQLKVPSQTLPGVELLGLHAHGRNIDFSDIGGKGGLTVADSSNLSHSYLTVLPMHDVWRGYRVIRNLFKAALD